MIRILFFLVLTIGLWGCQDVKRPEKPDNLIPKDKMVDILTDVYLNNAAKSINNRLLRRKGFKLDSLIYQKYEIDSLQFVRSHAYYNADLNTYNEIFREIEQRLDIMLKKADSAAGPAGTKLREKQDSIKRMKELIPPPDSE